MSLKNMTSVIIPARNEQFLKQTIEDILKKAKGDIQVIAILDGYWPKFDELSTDPRVNYIHYSEARGMRNAINAGVALARGQYIMKCDAHCMFAEGFDEELKAHCDYDWIVVPRRYPLDPYKWEIEKRNDNKYPIDYMILDENLNGIPVKHENNKDIDDLMTSQGSCWFMQRSYFDWLDLMDEEKYGTFWQEMQEIGLKCWLSGGKMKVNKNTWYAHWHKNEGRGYSLPSGEKEKTREIVNKWRNEKMFRHQRYDLNMLLEKFKDFYE